MSKMIRWLESKYGEIHGSSGKSNDYLVMWLDYLVPGEVQILTEDYMRGVLDIYPEEITESPETPAATNLFVIREENERGKLDETRAQAFHHATAQLLFTGIRYIKDAQTAIAFLMTRVRNPEEDDGKKLWRLLGYLKRTINLPLILQVDGVNVLEWWVDESYTAHENMRGHTRGKCQWERMGEGQ